MLKGKTKELINPTAINQMFELDFSDHKNSGRDGLSKEDRRFLEIVEQGIHQCKDGHYELPLPFYFSLFLFYFILLFCHTQ